MNDAGHPSVCSSASWQPLELPSVKAPEEGLQRDAAALEKHPQGLQQHRDTLESASLCLDFTAPCDTQTPADRKLVAKEDLKRRRSAFEKQEPQCQQPAVGADHASCSKLLVPNAARRLHGKTLAADVALQQEEIALKEKLQALRHQRPALEAENHRLRSAQLRQAQFVPQGRLASQAEESEAAAAASAPLAQLLSRCRDSVAQPALGDSPTNIDPANVTLYFQETVGACRRLVPDGQQQVADTQCQLEDIIKYAGQFCKALRHLAPAAVLEILHTLHDSGVDLYGQPPDDVWQRALVALDLAPQQLAALMALHAGHLARVAVVREQCQALCALHQRGQAADYQQAGLQAKAISASAGAWLQHLESCLQLLQPLQIAHALVACWPWTPDVARIMAGAAGDTSRSGTPSS